MEYRYLGGSGFQVPVLGLGTATFGGGTAFFRAWGETGVEGATRLVDIALEAGANLFDSADSYSDGLAEEILGKAIAGRRERVLISTKATFRTGPGPNDVGSSRHHLIAACEASLRRLGTDYIDLWQMHAFDARTPVEETLRALQDLVQAGKVRYVGCSNFSGWQLMKSLATADRHGWPRYVAHQAYYSLLAREYEWELMPLALDQKVGTVVWSPLSGGRLSGKIGRDRPAPAGSRTAALGGMGPEVPAEHLYAIVEALEAIAAETGRSVSQVALNWVLRRPSVAVAVIGARDEAQLRDNLGAADFALSDEQVARLDAASTRAPIYPYWHQRATFVERNPPAVPMPSVVPER
ncbi:aryl-alcohol dehydrogenase-like predicted oxidoreductase [Plasticicumulans lactativorans]|uniref:Aryl-alcohol dehydrogenase-like predicted oxidoreductase n=1 Tax=Plasticicumulans lactativorans TaxID=1133106 RepID=A0A4R2L2T3_9GAMM|nr:aldo/keto reductase [Plasticicumulans lactativorans]TCO80663.1 aryl-alcohol dehydrogenase-like predicted oxidoreductase [Plasticicumulans lactativorans]